MTLEWPAPESQQLYDLIAPALAGLPGGLEWSLGGGTALAMWLRHRLSKDIDLFFESSAALRLLSPQHNPDTKRIAGRWQEPGHYLKFEIAGIGDIDILVTRTWLEPPSVRTLVSGTPMAVQRPAEVIARKIAYRAAGFKLRDFFDLAALARYDIEQIGELRGLIETHIGDLRSRWTVLSARLPEQLEHEVTAVGDGHLVADSLGLIVEQVLSGRQAADGTSP
jgi:hypothetical protein